MTTGFHTIINFPYEGCLITEYPTKAEALYAHCENLKQVELDPSKSTGLLGVALVHIEVIDEKGEWREIVK